LVVAYLKEKSSRAENYNAEYANQAPILTENLMENITEIERKNQAVKMIISNRHSHQTQFTTKCIFNAKVSV